MAMTGALVWLSVALWLSGSRRLAVPSSVGDTSSKRDDDGGIPRPGPAVGREGPGLGRAVGREGPGLRPTAERTARSDRVLRLIAVPAVGLLPILLLGPAIGALGAALLLALVPAALRQLRRREARAVDPAARRSMPLTLDLLAAGLRSGQPVPAALTQVLPVAEGKLGRQLREVAGLLRFGADAKTAWRDAAEDVLLAPVAATAIRSSESGIRLADGFERLAEQLRNEYRAAAVMRAHRAGVWTMAPLGLCFLPAFVCLGVIPVVVGMGSSLLPDVRW
jgi:Flp pilus assembly protein TadB